MVSLRSIISGEFRVHLAYYPVYENRREEYVENFWRLVNWPVVSQLYIDGQNKRSDL